MDNLNAIHEGKLEEHYQINLSGRRTIQPTLEKHTGEIYLTLEEHNQIQPQCRNKPRKYEENAKQTSRNINTRHYRKLHGSQRT